MAIKSREIDSPCCKLFSTKRCSCPVFPGKPRTHFLYLNDVLSDNTMVEQSKQCFSEKPYTSDSNTITTSVQTSSAARSSPEFESSSPDYEKTSRVLPDKDSLQKSVSPDGVIIDSSSSACYNSSTSKNSEQCVDAKEKACQGFKVIDKSNSHRKYRTGWKSQAQRLR